MNIDYSKKNFTDDEKKTIKEHTNLIKTEHPNHIPILIQIDSNVLKLEKCKYLFSAESNVYNCLCTIEKKLNTSPNDSLIFTIINFSNNETVSINNNTNIKTVYDKYKDKDTNMLVIRVSRQTTYKWVKSLASYYLGY